MTESAAHVRVIEETSAYWRVLFENPPFNIVDATTDRDRACGRTPASIRPFVMRRNWVTKQRW